MKVKLQSIARQSGESGVMEELFAGEISVTEGLPDNQSAVVEALKLGWRGGVICKVLRSGSIQSGDDINIVG